MHTSSNLPSRIRELLRHPNYREGATAPQIVRALGTDPRNTYAALRRMRDAYIVRRGLGQHGRKAAFWSVVVTPADVLTHRVLAADLPEVPSTPPALGEYWAGQGGRYLGVYNSTLIFDGLVHLVVGDCSAEMLPWGTLPTPTRCAESRTDGRANTREILDVAGDFPAACWAANYVAEAHSDFHLPSVAEVQQLVSVSRVSSLVLPMDRAWTSTQHSVYGAFTQEFRTGDSSWSVGKYPHHVLPMRWVALSQTDITWLLQRAPSVETAE